MEPIVSDKIITLMRGDSFTAPIYINVGTKLTPRLYKLMAGDKLYFGLMEPNQAFENAVLKKTFDCASPQDKDGNTLLMLQPEDTERLLVGKYYYMIKLLTVDAFGQEAVRTIIKPSLFWLEGNNVKPEPKTYYDTNTYKIDRVVFEGGEITLPPELQGAD